ncbi:hypothetical protein [Fructobacillus papyrifericola]|uniref:Uncharacterized protein n=1 Tax=Fructobacillus papyrifericola TaxID=2713172 RepID=A0ABS5QUM0_9LACO|nr:hypothetical protein [Fructobacillus papyrifericola]MBS9336245.1 hypothetical protein [Fructobacillus papyrifericola]
MEITLRILIAIYAVLMLVATTQSIKKNQKGQLLLNVLNIMVSVILLLGVLCNWFYFTVIAAVSLIAYQALAISRGFSLHDFHLKHHLVRLCVTGLILIALYLF